MKPLLLVDGYNIIGAWREAKKAAYSIEESRDRLFDLLQDYAGYTDEEIILVFDGHHSDRKMRSENKQKHATVVFTKQGETADSYIERQVHLAPKYRAVRVATNDALEQSQILASGAIRVTASELIISLNEVRTREAEKRETALLTQRNPLSRHLTKEQRDIFERLRRGQ